MRGVGSVFGVLIVVIAIVVSIYGCVAGRDIAPADATDLAVARPELADEDNAYTHFNVITNLLYWPSNRVVVKEYLAGKEVDKEVIQDILSRNAEVFPQIERGLECQMCLAPQVTSFETLLPHVAWWLKAARLMTISSEEYRLNGDYASAIDRCSTLLRFADCIHRDADCLIHYLVGLAVLQLGLDKAHDLALDKGVSAEALTELASILDNMSALHLGLIRAVKAEYWIIARTVDELGRDGGSLSKAVVPDGRVSRFLLGSTGRSRYLFQREKTKLMFADLYREVIKNTSCSYAEMNFQSLEEQVELGEKGWRWRRTMRPNAIGEILRALLVPAVSGILEKKCQNECLLEATRLVVGCRRYALANGSLPDTCEALVPTFLTRLPLDPYNGEPFRYAPEKRVIYSVGLNLTDDGGASEGGVREGRQRWKQEDIVFVIE